jgi:SNF2 family DNA or RNA helicase
VLQAGADKLIQKAIAPYILRLEAEDYIDMPEVVLNNIRVSLPEGARKVYDDLEEEMFTQLDNGVNVNVASAGAMTNKLAQVANGGLYYDSTEHCDHKCDGALFGTCTCYFEGRCDSVPIRLREKAVLHDAKTEALVDLVDELQGSPLLVAYEFKHDLERIRKALGKDIPYIGGGVAPKRVSEIITAWNRDEIPVLPAHPASMSHGLNLQKGSCRHVAHYGITWDFELYDQFNRRVRRQGSKHAEIFLHHIIARDTVDEAKLRALYSKNRTQKGLLDALKSYRAERRRK